MKKRDYSHNSIGAILRKFLWDAKVYRAVYRISSRHRSDSKASLVDRFWVTLDNWLSPFRLS